MVNELKESLWQQFGASIDMLENAILLWPEEKWDEGQRFFYTACHCLVFLDYYLTMPAETFSSSLPFTITAAGELPDGAIDDVLPDRVYSKKELLGYLLLNREKCHDLIAGLTEEKCRQRWIEDGGGRNYSVFELLLYNMRHVQHHAAQLNLYLRQAINNAPKWVARAKKG
jgi:hypothetical protein